MSDGLVILKEGVELYSPSIIVRRERANLCDRLWCGEEAFVPFWGEIGAARHGERFAPDWALGIVCGSPR